MATTEPTDDGWLFHATSRDRLEAILREGLNPVCYLARMEVAKYYAETVEDEGEVPVLLAVSVTALELVRLEADLPGIQEPLTYTLKMTEEDVREAWDKSGQKWEDSLAIIKSVRCRGGIPPSAIRVVR